MASLSHIFDEHWVVAKKLTKCAGCGRKWPCGTSMHFVRIQSIAILYLRFCPSCVEFQRMWFSSSASYGIPTDKQFKSLYIPNNSAGPAEYYWRRHPEMYLAADKWHGLEVLSANLPSARELIELEE